MSNKGLAYFIPLSLSPLGSPDYVTSDFARHSVIVPRSLIPPTFFAENGFLQPVICFLPYYIAYSPLAREILAKLIGEQKGWGKVHMGMLWEILLLKTT